MTVPLPDKVATAVQQVKQALEQIYGERLRGVYLYGSYARGDATEDSDVDVLVVLDGEVHPGVEISRMGASINRICLEHDLLISTLPISAEWFATRNAAFFRNVRREGVAL